MAKRKPPVAYAESKGILFVKAKYSGIHPFVVLADGMRQSTFKEDKSKAYHLRVTDVIEWYEKEKTAEHPRPSEEEIKRYNGFLDTLKKELAKFDEEKRLEAETQ